MKTKTLGILIASMASVALMGAGFSTWVVSGTIDKTELAPVTVNVGTVEDSRLTITAQLMAEDKLTFDCGGVPDNERGGLIGVKDESATEDLSVTVQVTATKGASYTGGDIKIGWDVTLPVGENLALLKDVKYSGSSVKTAGEISIAPTTKGAQASLTFEFGWGSAFLGKNPARIAQGELTSEVTLETILRDLGTLKNEMQGSTVTIDINPTVNPAA